MLVSTALSHTAGPVSCLVLVSPRQALCPAWSWSHRKRVERTDAALHCGASACAVSCRHWLSPQHLTGFKQDLHLATSKHSHTQRERPHMHTHTERETPHAPFTVTSHWKTFLATLLSGIFIKRFHRANIWDRAGITTCPWFSCLAAPPCRSLRHARRPSSCWEGSYVPQQS